MYFSSKTILPVLALATSISAQTYSQCNPLSNPGSCPPDPALGTKSTINLNSPSDSFTEQGSINYGSDGAEFTVAKSGDNPHIASKWYIMFGHVEFVAKAAPGQGIVSSAVLMSDCLDEIDWEWLGGDNDQVQSNYFRKGQTVTGYNRGAFHSAPGTHDQFHTYAIDWTADQIVWSIDGTTVRVLEANNAENGDYPQTPMQIKVGSWAGGDPGNPQGPIDWAGGQTDYTQGPFTMYVKSIAATDYSTGSSYSYSGTDGTWQSIQSDGGSINPQGNGKPASAENAPAITSTVPNDSSAPLAFDPHDSASVYATRTGWPWDGTATASVVPSGYTVDGNGNLQPLNTGAVPSPYLSSPPVSSPVSASGFGPEAITSGPITTGGPAPPAAASPSQEPQAVQGGPPAEQSSAGFPESGSGQTSQGLQPSQSAAESSAAVLGGPSSEATQGVEPSPSSGETSAEVPAISSSQVSQGGQPSSISDESSAVVPATSPGSTATESAPSSSASGITSGSASGETARSTETGSQQSASTTSDISVSDSTTAATIFSSSLSESRSQSRTESTTSSTTASESRSMTTSTVRDSTVSSEPSSTSAGESPTETPPAPANSGVAAGLSRILVGLLALVWTMAFF